MRSVRSRKKLCLGIIGVAVLQQRLDDACGGKLEKYYSYAYVEQSTQALIDDDVAQLLT